MPGAGPACPTRPYRRGDRPTSVAGRSHPRDWVDNAVRLIEADARRSADTHLLRYPLPSGWCTDVASKVDVQLYLKDETTHITGSLKHRLARSLFLYALCNGWIGETTTVIEASSGSTAVSEAYFAALLGRAVHRGDAVVDQHCEDQAHRITGRPLPFRRRVVAGVRRGRAAGRGDRRTLPRPVHQRRARHRLARQQQHRRVDLRSDARGASIPIPEWIVVGAGTGGTSATIGRYIRYRRYPTRLCVVDPENSAFFPSLRAGPTRRRHGTSSRIEGIGRPRVEPSFLPDVVDRMVRGTRRVVGGGRAPRQYGARPTGRTRRRARTCGGPSDCWPR